MEGDLGCDSTGEGDLAGGSGDFSSSKTFSRSTKDSVRWFNSSNSDSSLSKELKIFEFQIQVRIFQIQQKMRGLDNIS